MAKDVGRASAGDLNPRARLPGKCLSTQVPAKSTYLTDGPSRRGVLGKRTVDLRHARQPGWHRCSGSAHLGPVRATDVVQVAIRQLSARDKKMLAASAVQAPAWMWRTLVSIANTISGALDG